MMVCFEGMTGLQAGTGAGALAVSLHLVAILFFLVGQAGWGMGGESRLLTC